MHIGRTGVFRLGVAGVALIATLAFTSSAAAVTRIGDDEATGLIGDCTQNNANPAPTTPIPPMPDPPATGWAWNGTQWVVTYAPPPPPQSGS